MFSIQKKNQNKTKDNKRTVVIKKYHKNINLRKDLLLCAHVQEVSNRYCSTTRSLVTKSVNSIFASWTRIFRMFQRIA